MCFGLQARKRRAGLDDGRMGVGISESYTVVRTYRSGTVRSGGEQDGENMKGRWPQGVEGNILTVERVTKKKLEELTCWGVILVINGLNAQIIVL